MVWFWDAGVVRVRPEELLEAGDAASAGHVRTLPETVFLPRRSSGICLQPCREGFELQDWRDGVLLDSFWFSECPDAGRIDWFCRRRGAEGTVPERGDARELAAEPWSSPVSLREWAMANERALVAAGFAFLLVLLVWQEARLQKVEHLRAAATEQLEHLEEDLGPALAARNELLRLKARNRNLASILNQPSQALVMGLVDQAVPSESARFHDWRYQQGELRVTIEDADLDPIAYVESLEAVPLFEQVQVGRSQRNNRVEISLRVRA